MVLASIAVLVAVFTVMMWLPSGGRARNWGLPADNGRRRAPASRIRSFPTPR